LECTRLVGGYVHEVAVLGSVCSGFDPWVSKEGLGGEVTLTRFGHQQTWSVFVRDTGCLKHPSILPKPLDSLSPGEVDTVRVLGDFLGYGWEIQT
jgi:hypothetical protein